MASNVQDAGKALAANVLIATGNAMDMDGKPLRQETRMALLRTALADFARAIVDEVRAGSHARQDDVPDVQCTDEELATALLAAQGLASASPAGDRTLIARALLRMRAERRSDSQRLAAYRALLAADYALKRAFCHAPDGRQDALLDERSQARAEALAEALRVDREFAERAMCPPEDDAELQPPTLAPDALPTVPGMAESDAQMRAEMAVKGASK